MRRYVDVDVDQRDGGDAYLILKNNNELKECWLAVLLVARSPRV